MVVGKESANGTGRHGEEQVTVLGRHWFTARDPVCFASISQVLGVFLDTVQVVPRVGLALANRGRNAGFELEGIDWITSTETVGTGTTFSVFC